MHMIVIGLRPTFLLAVQYLYIMLMASTTCGFLIPRTDIASSLSVDDGSRSGLNAFPSRKMNKRANSLDLRRRIDLKEMSVSTVNGSSERTEMYEVVLGELESEKLYGNSPRLCELDSLAHWLRKGKLNIAPKYQRGYVWKPDRASRLIVTVLCNRIVPAIVLHEKSKGIFDVVDGKQRLTSLLSFYLAGDDPDLHKKFEHICVFDTLTKLDENYESLEGLTYNALSEERQHALASYTIPCTIIPYGTPKEEVFSCYEDINSGGEDLKAQQLRRAVYYGEYIELLDRLANDQNFQAIRDPKSFRKGTYALCPKESDRELVLRAFAWARKYRSYKRPLKSFLNEELQYYENMNTTDPIKSVKEMDRLEIEFTTIMKIWRNVFSETDGAFRKWEKSKSGKWGWSSSINAPLWDTCYLAFADLLYEYPTEPIYAQCKDKLQDAMQDLFKSGKLDLSGTVTVAKFMERKDVIHKAMRKVLSQEPRRTRNFLNTKELREKLFIAQGGLCTICNQTIDGNRIHDGSYVHVDHKTPWSKGGSSTIENAALTHATCNMSKGAQFQ